MASRKQTSHKSKSMCLVLSPRFAGPSHSIGQPEAHCIRTMLSFDVAFVTDIVYCVIHLRAVPTLSWRGRSPRPSGRCPKHAIFLTEMKIIQRSSSRKHHPVLQKSIIFDTKSIILIQNPSFLIQNSSDGIRTWSFLLPHPPTTASIRHTNKHANQSPAENSVDSSGPNRPKGPHNKYTGP